MISYLYFVLTGMTDSGNAVNLGPQPSTVFANLEVVIR
jgi:hypothetical protein